MIWENYHVFGRSLLTNRRLSEWAIFTTITYTKGSMQQIQTAFTTTHTKNEKLPKQNIKWHKTNLYYQVFVEITYFFWYKLLSVSATCFAQNYYHYHSIYNTYLIWRISKSLFGVIHRTTADFFRSLRTTYKLEKNTFYFPL